jgi:hypothetical protein
MPDHVHIVAPDRGKEGVLVLGKVLGASARAAGKPQGRGVVWDEVPPAQPLPSVDKVMRNVRYVWLNPCRPWSGTGRSVRLLDDPLVWPWSTLRDSIGAIIDPWVPQERLAEAFGWEIATGLAERIHRYATRDDHVAQGARQLPQAPAPTEVPACGLEDVVEAALATTRSSREALCKRSAARRVAVGLAYRQGWSMPTRLAKICGVHAGTIHRIARRARPAELDAAALCLDPRLRMDADAILRKANVAAA